GQRRFRGGARLYDAIYLASNDLMKKRSGRKAVIVLGDGVDRGSKVPLTEALDSAQRADTLIYSIHIHPEVRPRGGSRGGMERPGGWGGSPWDQGPWGGGRMGRHGGGYPRRAEQPDGKTILQQMAKETGGYFEFSKKKTLGDIYTEIADELRNEYLLSFRPVSPGPGFRKIKVTVKRKGCTVQVREGYFSDVNS
ncbi:MAG: VWA domain-containing protein, partial [Bryobacteraceae bacterium]